VKVTDFYNEVAAEQKKGRWKWMLSPSLSIRETFEKGSILFKIKEGNNFNHRNMLNISRIEI
jgi:hypothetical protein